MNLRPLLLLPIFSTSIHAADWPQWRGPARTGEVPASGKVPATLPAEPKVLWRVPVGDGFASPVVSSGRVFHLDNQDGFVIGNHLDSLGSAKNLVCIDLATGQLAWEKTGFTQTDAGRAEAAWLVMGKNILVLNDAGELVLFAADPKEYREISRTQAAGENMVQSRLR